MIASSMPQPTAAPLTAAITGTSVSSSAFAAGVMRGASARLDDGLRAGIDHDLLDVVARAERGIAAGNDEAPRRRVRDRVGELRVGGERERVARLGPVDA